MAYYLHDTSSTNSPPIRTAHDARNRLQHRNIAVWTPRDLCVGWRKYCMAREEDGRPWLRCLVDRSN